MGGFFLLVFEQEDTQPMGDVAIQLIRTSPQKAIGKPTNIRRHGYSARWGQIGQGNKTSNANRGCAKSVEQ